MTDPCRQDWLGERPPCPDRQARDNWERRESARTRAPALPWPSGPAVPPTTCATRTTDPLWRPTKRWPEWLKRSGLPAGRTQLWEPRSASSSSDVLGRNLGSARRLPLALGPTNCNSRAPNTRSPARRRLLKKKRLEVDQKAPLTACSKSAQKMGA